MTDYNIVGSVLFSESLSTLRQSFESWRKDAFDAQDRIVIKQDIEDDYPYIDGVGSKLIQIQKIINQVDISNCFFLLITANKDIRHEIDFVTEFYSVDSTPIQYAIIDGGYQKKIKQYANTACKKLWNHFYVGPDANVNPCCLSDHRFPLGSINDTNAISNAQRIRETMTAGYRDRACAVCYEKEDSGVLSDRQTCDPTKMKIGVTDIDIRLNNICNFKCRMCSEYFSSSIQQETITLYGKNAVLGFEKISLDSTSKQTKNQHLRKILPLITTELDSIYFAGGEPLITDEHYKILDRLIDVGNRDLAIRYNTNLSTLTYKNIFVIDKWRQFSDVTVGASIDASDAVAEYMRHGTVWHDVVNNIHRIKQHAPHVNLQINSTVSFLTVENLITLQKTWIDQQIFSITDLKVNLLTDPNFLSVAVLPDRHKKRLGAIIEEHIDQFKGTELAHQWYNVLKYMRSRDCTFALPDFQNRTRVLDMHRNESFVAVFPEFQDIYG